MNIPPTRFTCQGRASGYYADVDTGCQVSESGHLLGSVLNVPIVTSSGDADDKREGLAKWHCLAERLV